MFKTENIATMLLGTAICYGGYKLIDTLCKPPELKKAPDNIVQRVQELAIKMEINPVPEVYIGETTQATLPLFWEKPMITLMENTKDFFICHEMAHLKYNSARVRLLIIGIAIPILACLSPLSALFGVAATTIIFRANECYSESEADRIGMQFASATGIEEAIQEFHQDKAHLKAVRESASGLGIWKKLFIQTNGDLRFIDYHPSCSSRISSLESELAKRC